jgi:site-specific DNA-methyltransferase (adenine-specific)
LAYTDIFTTEKKYSIIYADPPWSYQDKKCNGAAELQYRTMPIKEICALPIDRIAAPDCVLFMWATYPMLPEALELIKAWGFTYKSIGFQWIKQNRSGRGWFFGLGRWTRGNTEPCLIAVRGKPKRASASVGQIIEYPLGRHSAKPPIARDKIMELMGGGSAIELFARSSAAGWDVWGNQAPTGEEPQPEPTMPPPKVAAGQLTLFECLGGVEVD